MPLIVTDQDVLAQVAKDDGAAKSIDDELAALGDRVPAATRAAWTARYAAYGAWRAIATRDLGGGFFGGAWFGVPTYGNQAIAYEREFEAWQELVNTLARGASPAVIAPLPVDPATVAIENATLPYAGLDTSTKLLAGGALAVAFLFLWRLK